MDLVFYVRDILLSGRDEAEIYARNDYLHKKYTMYDQGNTTKIFRDKGCLKIKKTSSLLEDYALIFSRKHRF